MLDPLRRQRFDVVGERFPRGERFERRNQAFQDQRRLAGAGHAGHDREPSLGDGDVQGLYRVQGAGGQMDRPRGKKLFLRRLRAHDSGFPGKKGPDAGRRILRDLGNRPLRDDPAARCPGPRPHLDDPVGLLQNLRVVIHQQDGVPVRHQIVHHAGESHNVGRVQTDGGLVQHIQDAGGAVSDRAGKLHPLALARGKSGRRPVKREIRKAQIHQALGDQMEGGADALRHGAHLHRQRRRHAAHPFAELNERHAADLIQAQAPELRRSGRVGKPRPAAVGTDLFPEELLHTLHALLIRDLVEGVEHGGSCAVIGEIHFARRGRVRLFWAVEDMLLDHGAVEDDLFFFVCQFSVGDVRPDAHGAAHIRHQGPHQTVPRGDGTLVDAQCFVRDQRALVHGADRSRAAAAFAGALTVEGQLLRAGTVKGDAADGADDFPFRRDAHRRRAIVPVGAAVGSEAREHQTQAVEQLRPGAESGADAGHTGPLVQGQGRGDIQHVVHIGPRGLRHAPARIGGERLQIAARALRVQDTQRQRGFPGAGHARDPDDLVQRNVDIDDLQIVDPRAPDLYFLGDGIGDDSVHVQCFLL